jgi:hypothetical protein
MRVQLCCSNLKRDSVTDVLTYGLLARANGRVLRQSVLVFFCMMYAAEVQGYVLYATTAQWQLHQDNRKYGLYLLLQRNATE